KGNYKDVKEITKRLIGRVFTIKSEDEELQISWLSSANYISGKGLVTLSFDRKLKPFLLQLKNRFTKYKLHQIMQLKSSFSIRIYELLKQYQKIGVRIFDVESLREILGIEKEQYKNFNDFKRYVILVAQEEVAAKTDISFEFEEIKVGRSVG
ncbi:MAG: replication initiation protein, partial [Candidatus Riflebacteria bacterium]|nr:replication initiation protein [Candidatus Riflebacteria bacterium]